MLLIKDRAKIWVGERWELSTFSFITEKLMTSKDRLRIVGLLMDNFSMLKKMKC